LYNVTGLIEFDKIQNIVYFFLEILFPVDTDPLFTTRFEVPSVDEPFEQVCGLNNSSFALIVYKKSFTDGAISKNFKQKDILYFAF